MGLDAQVIAIGPFSREIANFLEGPSESYDDVAPGVTVICNAFIAPTRTSSYELAGCMDAGVWEFGRHASDFDRINIEALLMSDFAEDVPQLLRLNQAELKFYRLLNG